MIKCMNEKTLEKVTGLSRRQIIQLQKKVIQRKNKITVGLAYDYSKEEVKLFVIASFFKNAGYKYSEIKEKVIKQFVCSSRQFLFFYY